MTKSDIEITLEEAERLAEMMAKMFDVQEAEE